MDQVIHLVVPCYNEAKRLSPEKWLTFLESAPWLRLLFVDDGSSDGTCLVLEEIAALSGGRAQALILPENQGKGGAIRQGTLKCLENLPESRDRQDWIGYWDADLSTPLEELELFREAEVSRGHLSFLLGSRISRLGSQVERDTVRHYIGRVYATLVSAILNLRIYDTQCGAKLIRAGLCRDIYAEPFLSRWCFDAELIARAMIRLGSEAFEREGMEIPLRIWTDVKGSKVKLMDGFIAFRDLYRIHRKYSRLLSAPR